MLELLIGRSGSGKTGELLQEMAAGDGETGQVLIVPEQHSHAMERQLCAMGGSRISRRAEVLSFSRLAGRVFSQAGGVAHPTLDAGGRMLLMYTAVAAVSDRLKVYGPPSRKPEFLTGLLATLDECKSCCVSAEALRLAGEETGGSEGEKLQDLALIFASYEALTARQGADPRDRLTRLAHTLQSYPWGAGKRLYLDGFTDFTPQELLVVRQLLRQAEKVTVALTCDGLEEGETLFDPARYTARSLRSLCREENILFRVKVQKGFAMERPDALRHLEGELFRPGGEPRPYSGEGLTLYRAQSPTGEVEWVAHQILRLVREEGLRFRDVAVTARSMEEYGERVETVFARYGVPVFQSGMSDVLQKPVLTLIGAALQSAWGDYAYDDLFRYLKTGLTGLTAEECDLLENYALKWQLKGSQWRQKKEWTMHPRGYGQPWTQEDRALLERLDTLRRQVMAPLERLRCEPVATGRGQAIALYRFLEEISLARHIEERADELQRRGEAALAEEYRQLWEILCNALEQSAATLGDKPMELEEFSRLFSLVLSQYDVGSIPVSLDAVTAGEMPRLAHRHCKVLFLLGADEGSIPKVTASPGLLSDDDRSLLTSYGLELASSAAQRLLREETILYEALALPSDRLFISYAALRGGEEHTPCGAVERLQALLPGLVWTEERDQDNAFRLSAPEAAMALAASDDGVRRALSALPGYRERLERLERGIKLERGHLGRDTVELLYGRKVPMSASRMDKYKSCHFSYFMEFGLGARPRTVASFRAPEYGTFVHYVLQHVLQSGEWSPGIDRDKLRALTETVVEQYVSEELGGLEKESARFRYLFARLKKTVFAIVENATQEMEQSDFKPLAFELGFGRGKGLPPVEVQAGDVTVSLTGFVDRVDGWEHDGRLYLRVVDYKTGRKSFDLTEIWNGLGLQMLLYLFAIGEMGRERFGGKELVPAGVLYLPAREAVIAGSRNMSEESRRREVDKALRRKGVILEDEAVVKAMEHPEEDFRFLPVKLSRKTGAITGPELVTAERLGRLEKHVGVILREICQELSAGNIAADPYWRGGDQSACRFCDYAAACHFEEGRGGDRRRFLPTVKAEAFWDLLERGDRAGGQDGQEPQQGERGERK